MGQLVGQALRLEKVGILLALVALGGLYVLALDQGHLFSLVQGSLAFDQNLIHEAVHDARHAAGFPCH